MTQKESEPKKENGGLVLARKFGQSITFNPGLENKVVVTVIGIERKRVKLHINAPETVKILRNELLE